MKNNMVEGDDDWKWDEWKEVEKQDNMENTVLKTKENIESIRDAKRNIAELLNISILSNELGKLDTALKNQKDIINFWETQEGNWGGEQATNVKHRNETARKNREKTRNIVNELDTKLRDFEYATYEKFLSYNIIGGKKSTKKRKPKRNTKKRKVKQLKKNKSKRRR